MITSMVTIKKRSLGSKDEFGIIYEATHHALRHEAFFVLIVTIAVIHMQNLDFLVKTFETLLKHFGSCLFLVLLFHTVGSI